MKHPHLVIGLGVVLLSAMPVFAKPAYVPSTVNLRTAPNTKSEIVAKIPGGSLVETKDCSEGWCEITWQDKTGFAIQSALDTSGRVPRQAAQMRASAPNAGYVPSARYLADDAPVYYGPPPPRVYYYGPYYRPYWGSRRDWW